MAKWPHNKNESTIKTNLVDTGIEEDVASLVASTLLSFTKDNDPNSSVGNCHIDNDHVQHSTPIRMVNMEDDISHEAEETVITNFLQFALENIEGMHQEDMNTIDCNCIRIGTFMDENEEPLA